MPLGILREPAPENPFFLQEHFVDAPETAKGESADDDGEDVVSDEQRERAESQTGDQPDPPDSLSPFVFHFDYSGMTDSDAQEYRRSDEDADKVHNTFPKLTHTNRDAEPSWLQIY